MRYAGGGDFDPAGGLGGFGFEFGDGFDGVALRTKARPRS